MLELFKTRRSVRQYLDKEVEKEKIDSIIKAALMSPTSMNKKSWEFIVVTDKEKRQALASSKKMGAQFLANTPVAIVIANDTTKVEPWVEDASIAATFIQLEAHDQGLASCWAQMRDKMYDESKGTEEYIRELLEIPENYGVACVIGIGYSNEEKEPYKEEELPMEKVHYNKF